MFQVLSVSHGLQSSPHVTHTAVPPNPPSNLLITKVEGNSVTLSWDPPVNSLFSDYLIQYRPIEEDVTNAPRAWTRVKNVPVNVSTFVLKDLTPGTLNILNLIYYGKNLSWCTDTRSCAPI